MEAFRWLPEVGRAAQQAASKPTWRPTAFDAREKLNKKRNVLPLETNLHQHNPSILLTLLTAKQIPPKRRWADG